MSEKNFLLEVDQEFFNLVKWKFIVYLIDLRSFFKNDFWTFADHIEKISGKKFKYCEKNEKKRLVEEKLEEYKRWLEELGTKDEELGPEKLRLMNIDSRKLGEIKKDHYFLPFAYEIRLLDNSIKLLEKLKFGKEESYGNFQKMINLEFGRLQGFQFSKEKWVLSLEESIKTALSQKENLSKETKCLLEDFEESYRFHHLHLELPLPSWLDYWKNEFLASDIDLSPLSKDGIGTAGISLSFEIGNDETNKLDPEFSSIKSPLGILSFKNPYRPLGDSFFVSINFFKFKEKLRLLLLDYVNVIEIPEGKAISEISLCFGGEIDLTLNEKEDVIRNLFKMRCLQIAAHEDQLILEVKYVELVENSSLLTS